ncbi:hypothetical protein [Hydrogenophaga palleronii]|uniref:hypothetical protein n=1 Tax=Hydrogenophaga palleronii TaxID=65655 RepID=UPI000825F73A|nr:hypothetical protein [Hydrogenophaga palleronii]
MRARHWMGIAWPAFLLAGVLEMLVFAMVDPSDLHGFGGQPLTWSRQAVYTVAFFVFWGITLVSSALSVWLTGVGAGREEDVSRRSGD